MRAAKAKTRPATLVEGAMMAMLWEGMLLMQEEMDFERLSRVLGHHNRCQNGVKAAETQRARAGRNRSREGGRKQHARVVKKQK